MVLYHGSDVIVRNPEVRKTRDAKGGICCQVYRGDASGAFASEIRVQLAENRPQRQVQERLREYIL